ncbi:MAG: DUF1186 domain-containing protein [Planctomycetales bacterium]|nr:DUF1186 domain-containing protein [Planctomycetales bacterium]
MSYPTRLDRAIQIVEVCEEKEIAVRKWERTTAALNGLELTGASDDVRNKIESYGLSCNAILKDYDATVGTGDGSEFLLEEDDAAELVELALQLAISIRFAETNRILDRLRHHLGVLPEAEIVEARRHQKWFTPLLIAECQTEINRLGASDGNDDDVATEQNSIPFFSLFLFSEWSCVESVEVVLQALKLPGDRPFQLFSDGIHEHVSRYLAQFLYGEIDRIDELVRDPKCNLYVRWAAVGSYKYLVRDGVLATTEAIRRLDRLFEETKVVGEAGRPGLEHPYELSAGIIETIVSIDGGMNSQLSQTDFDFVDEFIIRRDEFGETTDPESQAALAEGLRQLPPTKLDDCIEFLRHWNAFTPSRTPPKRLRSTISSKDIKPAAKHSPSPAVPPPKSTTARRAEKTPRNAKCPCGSGRKYKLCCRRNKPDANADFS